MAETKKSTKDLSNVSTAALQKMMKGASPILRVQIATEIRNRSDQEAGIDDMMPSGDLEEEMPSKVVQQKRKGGMVKKYAKGGYANCGASVPPAQKSSKK
jgi:hypothetical protein